MDPQQDAVQGDADHSSEGLGSFDDDDEMDNDDSRGNNGQPRAKKRRKYINKACDNCRTRHSRCDGKEPCGPCAKKGFPCGYSAPPSRRGPVSERQLQELITSLTKQIESEKKMKKDWKNKIQRRSGPPSPTGSSMGGGGGGGGGGNGSGGSGETGPYTPSSESGSGGSIGADAGLHFGSSSSAAAAAGVLAPGSYGNPLTGNYAAGSGGDSGSWANVDLLQTYIDAYQLYIQWHISAHPSVFEQGMAAKVIHGNQRSPLAFQMYAVLANGARVVGNQQASVDFATRARRTLGAVFDQTDGLVAQGLMILAYYMSGQAEADKTMYYLQLARKMCQHLDTRSSEYYLPILMAIGFTSPHHEEKLEVLTELQSRLETMQSNANLARHFTLTLAIIQMQVELEMARLRMDYNPDYATLLQNLDRLEKSLTSENGTCSKLGFRLLIEIMRTQCYCALGLRELVTKSTTKISEFAKFPEFQYVPVNVLAGLENIAILQLEQNRPDLVREHIHRFTQMSAIYPSMRLIVQKLQEKLKPFERRSIEEEGLSRMAVGSYGQADGSPLPFTQGYQQQRPHPLSTEPPSTSTSTSTSTSSGLLHDRVLPYPAPSLDSLGISGLGSMGGNNRMAQERGVHLGHGGFEGMGSRLSGVPHFVAAMSGDRGNAMSIEDMIRERAMVGGIGPLYSYGTIEQQMQQHQQHQQELMDYRLQERAMLERRLPGMPTGQQPQLNPYMERGFFNNGGMQAMHGAPALGGRGLPTMSPGYGNGRQLFGPAAGGPQQLQNGPWAGMVGYLGDQEGAGGNGIGNVESSGSGGPLRHHQYTVYGSDPQGE